MDHQCLEFNQWRYRPGDGLSGTSSQPTVVSIVSRFKDTYNYGMIKALVSFVVILAIIIHLHFLKKIISLLYIFSVKLLSSCERV